MFSHANIWSAIDKLAARNGLSTSGLARRAGLDPTTFNKSKRFARDGRARWPSTESIRKILEVTGESAAGFFAKLDAETKSMDGMVPAQHTVPYFNMDHPGVGAFFDEGGRPTGQEWDQVPFPKVPDQNLFGTSVPDDSMYPLYRQGDTVIVAHGVEVRPGDRVLVKSRDNEFLVKILLRETATTVELHSLNAANEDRTFKRKDIEWMARIVWVSQ